MSNTYAELLESSFDYDEDEDVCACERCGDEYDEQDMIYFDSEWICEDCADERTFICADCGDRHWNDSSYSSGNGTICEHCYDYHYTSCSECGRVIHNDDVFYTDDDEYSESSLCEGCYELHKAKHIHDYNYRPQPIFHRMDDRSNRCGFCDGIHLGVELEIADAGESDENAEELLAIANEVGEHLYIKRDGSLDDGLELVSHPAVLEYWQAPSNQKRVQGRY